MVDMSHGPLPTEDEVKRQLDFLARWKANQYYFYAEASIELDGFPLLNAHGRYSKDEVRRIIAYGKERHIDVIPCLELYGHLHDLFRVKKYSDLADANHVPHIVATGVTNWNQIAPDFTRSFENIDTFLAAGRKLGALGIMNTIWTDDAEMLMRAAWPGMAYGAAGGWQTSPMDPKTFFSAYSQLIYSYGAAQEFASALDAWRQA